jgi:hypothetical protein
MQEPILLGKRIYEFYGTGNDWYIPNINSCFPKIESGDSMIVIYHPLITGIDHVGIGHHLAKKIIDESILIN